MSFQGWSVYCSSDVRLVESALKTLTAVLSKVEGADSWPLVQELLVFLCTILDPKLAKDAGTCAVLVGAKN